MVAIGVGIATVGTVIGLWWAGTAGLIGPELVTARFDALRTGLSIGLGGGGLFALYLAWRRQNATEVALVQKERDQADVARAYELQQHVLDHTRFDAEARRVTDLYSVSVEQLGSDKAPVRLGGLYALERLAHDNARHRQTVVNVLCAYLRMPYTPSSVSTSSGAGDTRRDQEQEREVRLTAQTILANHLDPDGLDDDPTGSFWGRIDLNLAGAALINFVLQNAEVRSATFRNATFYGKASFRETTFKLSTVFTGARFTDGVLFEAALFTHVALFRGVIFEHEALFTYADFESGAVFTGAVFSQLADFSSASFKQAAGFAEADRSKELWSETVYTTEGGATFMGEARFGRARFASVWFGRSTFAGAADFTGARFSGPAEFAYADFAADVSLSAAHVLDHPDSRDAWPPGWERSSEVYSQPNLDGKWHLLELATPS
ncbi:pentapeptide repeat-containing protein [Amycolatopsis sp. TRM77291]